MNTKKSDRLVMIIMTVLLIAFFSLMLTACATTPEKIDKESKELMNAQKIGEQWIRTAPTYNYDGYNLSVKYADVLESLPQQNIITYTFTSSHSGYGDRSGQMLLQVETSHEIIVVIENGGVVSAIIDDDWDEFNNAFVSDLRIPEPNNTLTFIFEPKSCVETPWEILMKNSSIRWIRAPTDTEIITAMYGERYDITIHNVEKIKIADAVCMACGVCGTGYTFRIVVDEKDKSIFIADGWIVEPSNAQIANPASVNCVENGGKLEIKDEVDGQVGYCTLPNGNICEEWALFRGTCS